MKNAVYVVHDQPGHFALPPLPYALDALGPVISSATLLLHHGKHHRKYIDKLNTLLHDDPLAQLELDEVVRQSAGDPKREDIFNNAGQAWNHAFYWNSLTPKGGRPQGELMQRIVQDFGSYEKFEKEFAAAANGRFGSGWAWLVLDGGKLRVESTANADSPMARGVSCLLTLDVWEHAYYVDYRNEREKYVKGVIEKRLNWEFAEENCKGT
jgi:Fe-Mn family superoxide dismutase